MVDPPAVHERLGLGLVLPVVEAAADRERQRGRHVDEGVDPPVRTAGLQDEHARPGSALRRLASALPAEPPPTMTKSKRVCPIVGRCSSERRGARGPARLADRPAQRLTLKVTSRAWAVRRGGGRPNGDRRRCYARGDERRCARSILDPSSTPWMRRPGPSPGCCRSRRSSRSSSIRSVRSSARSTPRWGSSTSAASSSDSSRAD